MEVAPNFCERFAYITVDRDVGAPTKELSMSWWLSMHVQKYLDDQLRPTGINRAALEKIENIR